MKILNENYLNCICLSLFFLPLNTISAYFSYLFSHFVLNALSQGFAHNRHSYLNERKTGLMEAKVFFKVTI